MEDKWRVKRAAVVDALHSCATAAIEHRINHIFLFGSALFSASPRDIDLAIPAAHFGEEIEDIFQQDTSPSSSITTIQQSPTTSSASGLSKTVNST